jgi:hypothetical protein
MCEGGGPLAAGGGGGEVASNPLGRSVAEDSEDRKTIEKYSK